MPVPASPSRSSPGPCPAVQADKLSPKSSDEAMCCPSKNAFQEQSLRTPGIAKDGYKHTLVVAAPRPLTKGHLSVHDGNLKCRPGRILTAGPLTDLLSTDVTYVTRFRELSVRYHLLGGPPGQTRGQTLGESGNQSLQPKPTDPSQPPKCRLCYDFAAPNCQTLKK